MRLLSLCLLLGCTQHRGCVTDAEWTTWAADCQKLCAETGVKRITVAGECECQAKSREGK